MPRKKKSDVEILMEIAHRVKSRKRATTVPARRRRATRPLRKGREAHRYGAKYSGYGSPPAAATTALKTAKKAVTRAKKAVKKAPPSAAKTTAVRKVSKAQTAVKTAEHAVVVARKRGRPRVRTAPIGVGTPHRRRKRGITIPLAISEIMKPLPRKRTRRKRA